MAYWMIVLLSLVLAACLHSRLNGLSKFPGPLLASMTDVWRAIAVSRGSYHVNLRRLHAKHGDVVRIGPNILSLSNPDWIKLIYSSKGEFQKSMAYSPNDIQLPDGTRGPTTFSVRNNAHHAAMMKPIWHLYTTSHVLKYEERIDEVISTFIRVIDGFCEKGMTVDIGKQMDYLAHDVMASLTFGEEAGFLQQQKDIGKVLSISAKVLDYFAWVSQLPFLDLWLAKNSFKVVSARFPSFGQNMQQRCAEYIMARLQEPEGQVHDDFLDDFIRIGGGSKQPDKARMTAWLSNNVGKSCFPGPVRGAYSLARVAGSDTVAIELKAVIYYTLKHPAVARSLRDELVNAELKTPVSYAQARSLPFLDAVISEALRLHPAVGMPLERVVPAGGVQLPGGPYLDAGVCVGMNPWVVHMSPQVYGAGASVFNPERYLSETADVKTMRDVDMTFGAGRRACSGKNVAIVEIHKIVATIFLLYGLTLVSPEEWHITNSFFVRQGKIEARVRRRA